jgi:cytoskeletal protein CcmA (bactofilin family)
MFNRDALFGKKDEVPRNEPRSSVNVTPGLGGGNPPMRPQPSMEPNKPDLRFAEVSKQSQHAQQAQPQQREDATGSRLIVGPDIKLKGVEITDCDTLVVEGRVEASMDSRVIQIAEHGVFSGTVSIDVAEIRGTFEGELTARKQLVIYSTGRVSGEIRYGKIRIEEGGEISGEISTIAKPIVTVGTAPTVAAAQATPTPTPAPAPIAAPAAAVTQPTPPAPPSLAGAAPTGSRPAQSTPLTHSEQQSAAASREPSRAPRPGSGAKSSTAGVNTV